MPNHRLLSPRWLVQHSFALVIFVMLLTLGFWQLGRLEERRAANALRVAALDAPPLALTFVNADGAALAGRKVYVHGTFINSESVVLRGRRSTSGVDGVHLLTPLRLRDSDAAVLVDRGWLPANQQTPAALAAYAVEREVVIEGIAWPPQVRPNSPLAPRDLPLPGESRIAAWMRVDVAALQAQVSAPLLPIYVEALPGSNDAPLPLPLDPRNLDEGPHLGYALQWFSFATMLAIVYAALMRQELARKK
ncbi:MAG: SURF1 family protein [Candidatus Viridilinea halotolerans]|uniref:SURF1-like protein n=1 Tax=Candidatus Viridilinea halotolerans TaxID=2491704 RepID=A0A426TQQ8_9CHLR|nr:MAG: SURF1 family protein [Candidatus Viridilinea halotolerans]